MIRVQCTNCSSFFDTDERYAGMAANCPNCQAQITIPAPQPLSPGVGSAPPGQNQQSGAPAQSDSLTQGRSMGVAILLWFILNGTQYFYLGQTGKGIIFTCLDVVFSIVDIITCGIFCIVHGAWRLLWLVDTILVTGKLGKQPVSKWRFF